MWYTCVNEGTKESVGDTMNENVFYMEANNVVVKLIGQEFPNFNQGMIIRLLNYFHKLVGYEEEGAKIRPDVLFTDNIAHIAKNIENCYTLTLFEDDNEINFERRLKSLLCFCQKDWCVFIELANDKIQYGLIRSMNSIKEKNLKDLLEDKKEKISAVAHYFLVDVRSSSHILIKGAKGNRVIVNFGLTEQLNYNWEGVITRFVDASVSKLKTTQRKLSEIKTLYENIFRNAFQNVHGAICLVVDKDFKDNSGALSDGVWLKEPIELSKLFFQTKSYSESKLRIFSQLFVSMLNYDGITVVDNAGRILAYNVFVEISQKSYKNLIGGARRRAATTLLNSKNKKFVGVYFQSQDGDNSYEEVKINGKNKEVKN